MKHKASTFKDVCTGGKRRYYFTGVCRFCFREERTIKEDEGEL